MVLGIVGKGISPYDPVVLMDGGLVGVFVVLPAYWYWLSRTCERLGAGGAGEWSTMRRFIPALLPIGWGVAVIAWAFRRPVWFSFTGTYGVMFGGVHTGSGLVHLAGTCCWFVLATVPYMVVPRLRDSAGREGGAGAVEGAARPARRGIPRMRLVLAIAYVALMAAAVAKVVQFARPGDEPLHKACWEGDAAEVSRLIASGADVNEASRKGRMMLRSLSEILIRMGDPESAAYQWRPKTAPLHLAAIQGDKAVVGLLLEAGARVELKDGQGWTALHLSVLDARYSGDNSVVLRLLAAGADPNAYAEHGETPFHLACEDSGREVVKAMLEAGADVNGPTLSEGNLGGWTPLHKALWRGDRKDVVQVVEILIGAGADVNARTREGRTPLHMLSAEHPAGAAAALLGAGADTTIPDRYGRTAWDVGSDLPAEVRERLRPRGD